MLKSDPSLAQDPQSSPAELSRAGVPSPACDVVLAASHPPPEKGGPCLTCAFRQGTEANTTPHTMTLARLCVEGFRQFHCHEQPQLCRGWLAALNLRGTPESQDDKNWSVVAGHAADVLAQCIATAKQSEARP
jgi:hypothetical protein